VFGEMKMKANYVILETNALIKKGCNSPRFSSDRKNGSKKAKHRCARAINLEPMKKKGI